MTDALRVPNGFIFPILASLLVLCTGMLRGQDTKYPPKNQLIPAPECVSVKGMRELGEAIPRAPTPCTELTRPPMQNGLVNDFLMSGSGNSQRRVTTAESTSGAMNGEPLQFRFPTTDERFERRMMWMLILRGRARSV
jgi:hypothetical protein